MIHSTTTAIHPDAVQTGRAAVPPDELLTIVVETFAALADPTRARILIRPARRGVVRPGRGAGGGGVRVGGLAPTPRLADRRLVKPRRDGNVIYYAVDDQHLAALFREAEYHADHVRRGLPDHPLP